MSGLTFNKQQKVTTLQVIDMLFSRTAPAVLNYPFRISWVKQPYTQPSNCQVLIAVSKKKFPKAVHRNKVKRQVRELFRLHQHLLQPVLANKEIQIAISINYLGSTTINFIQTEANFIACLKKLIKSVEKAD